jgi:A/G-specific adenine glycosylase
LMDLGASICSVRNPSCLVCPVQTDCAARVCGTPTQFPVKTRKLKRSSLSLWMLWLQRADGAVWFEQRPVPGVWAGLYAFPLFENEADALNLLGVSERKATRFGSALKHVLTHKDMYLHPLELRVEMDAAIQICGQRIGRWVLPAEWVDLGMPAPIRRLLDMQKTCSG